MDRVKKFHEYLGETADVDAIALEIGGMPLFDYLVGEVCATQALYDFVRDVWDVAYSYGRHDAMADEGLTLEEMIKSGE